MSEKSKQKLVLNSSFEEMEKLEPFVDRLQDWASLNKEACDRILLTLSEAVNNAIIHGNNRQKHKKVKVVARIQDQQLQLSVEDEGNGFDPANLPDPLKEENLLNEGGRGIYLIKQYADEVRFSKRGTKITMFFYLN